MINRIVLIPFDSFSNHRMMIAWALARPRADNDYYVVGIYMIFVFFQFNEKRRVIQDLYFLGMVSHLREPKDSAFFNINAEIAINIGGNTAVGTLNLNGRTNQRIFFCFYHLTCYLKLFGTYIAD